MQGLCEIFVKLASEKEARTHSRTHACTHARTHSCTHACTHAHTHAQAKEVMQLSGQPVQRGFHMAAHASSLDEMLGRTAAEASHMDVQHTSVMPL